MYINTHTHAYIIVSHDSQPPRNPHSHSNHRNSYVFNTSFLNNQIIPYSLIHSLDKKKSSVYVSFSISLLSHSRIFFQNSVILLTSVQFYRVSDGLQYSRTLSPFRFCHFLKFCHIPDCRPPYPCHILYSRLTLNRI